ncbi:aminoglycoside phosphotransferase family protein [Micromonospora peucetia]|uniref:Aminoglycoside phosphotransferase family protein n=1 Tax=Micromonospora peucetia TaxID=47871 RepID=A0A1C6VZG7_9ACTN|nr:phosphotransferase [Micromonospora peucetia]MCX4390688.1 aminoglycoside phosphotransferase family protein [Micromonospora peucetia]WSA31636.1 aminoglycoside phosphotransferase family protein [Micromonospora peucetia]SCL71504.1 Phosphotransferase enzyme family protein [Micromonospora peucetia]
MIDAGQAGQAGHVGGAGHAEDGRGGVVGQDRRVDGARVGLAVDGLRSVAWAAFGRGLLSVERLTGGTKKGVYRLTLDDGSSGIAYVWHPAEDYWPAGAAPEPDDPFGHATGAGLFVAAHREFTAAGVRVPRLLLHPTATLLPGEVAVVEDVRGGTLQDLRSRDPRRAEAVLARLGDAVRSMHVRRRDGSGRPGLDGPKVGRSVQRIIFDRALRDLAEAATRVERIAAARDRLAAALAERYAAVAPRSRYGLIHGELGPDHVLVDEREHPVLVDIEGAMFLDVEWEHAFLELRFGDAYPALAVADLDEARLRLYRLALHLSLVAGPLRLLDGNFPDRAFMLGIVEHNTTRALDQLV